MNKEELSNLAEKVKAGTATKEEVFKFHEEFNKILSEVKELLE